MHRSTRLYLVVGISAVWVVAVVMSAVAALQSEPDLTAMTGLVMNVVGPATVLVALWPRTTHPDDAWEAGRETGDGEGYLRAYAEMDRRPRTGEIHAVR